MVKEGSTRSLSTAHDKFPGSTNRLEVHNTHHAREAVQILAQVHYYYVRCSGQAETHTCLVQELMDNSSTQLLTSGLSSPVH